MTNENKGNNAQSLHMQLVELVMERGGQVSTKLELLELLAHYKKLDKDFKTYLSWEKSIAYQKGMLEAMKEFDRITKTSKEG